jgi:tetratricopeptide (TPR) repeat protein
LNANDDAERVRILQAASADSAERAALLARAQLAGSPSDALASAKQAVALCKDYAYAYNLQGNADQKLQKLDDAELAYNHAVEAAPSYAAPRFNLGVLQLRRNDAKAAIDQFSAIINYNPDHPNVFLMRASARLKAGHKEQALDDLEEATRHAPTAAVWLMLGDTREKQHRGDPQEAYCKAAELGSAEAKALCKR